ncbi:hypothetical protein [Paenibacillus sp. ISL-20]|uniref:hypothetical protein n=1 Tax=Paenibacillus sp. ISL-20 TaxID=2819163 RepID=UPI001BE6D591|nr:hypothetical protein [Paenibacillus sp. ISL-20]MBT2759973.1 hypothetical protein [Paenibacillus sp. ISL-20]
MNHKEYSEVGRVGEEVWICDYRYNDIDNQPIRHITPRKVVVVSNEELPKNKRVYYSNFHFRPVNEKGKVLSQVIAPYDNTGYRAYSGTSLNIFYTREECKQHYLNQCLENLKRFEQAKISKIAYYDMKIEEINKEVTSLL